MTIMALSNIKAVTTTLPSCALDGVSIIVGDVKVLVELLVTELFSILFPLPSCKRLVREIALSVSTRMLWSTRWIIFPFNNSRSILCKHYNPLIIVNFARRQDYGLLCTFVAKVVTINKYTRMFSLRTQGGRGRLETHQSFIHLLLNFPSSLVTTVKIILSWYCTFTVFINISEKPQNHNVVFDFLLP